MKAIELLELLKKYADSYSNIAKESVVNNCHMNNLTNEEVSQDAVDAILVDFINYIGGNYGIDYALYTSDLRSNEPKLLPEKPKYPIGGFSPGNYMGICKTCNEEFMGDKYSRQCETCAIKSTTL